MRPAIDLVYRAIVRASTEMPTGSERQPLELESSSGGAQPDGRPLAARAPLALAQSLALGERARDLVGLLAQQPAGDQLRGRPRHACPPARSSSGRSRFASTTGRTGGRCRAAPRGSCCAAQVEARDLDLDAVDRARSRAPPSTLSCSWSSPSTGAKPSAAAAIASTPEPVPTSSSDRRRLLAGGQLQQQLQAQARGRVSARAERLPGIDHDLGIGRGRRSLGASHGGRTCSAGIAGAATGPRAGARDQHRAMELLPALVPVVGDLAGGDLHQRVAHGRASRRGAPAAPRGAVDGVLDRPRRHATSSTPAGASSSSSASTSSACPLRDANREPDHAAWLPQRAPQLGEHRLLRAQVLLGQAVVQLLHQLALLGAQTARDDDVDDHAQVTAAGCAERAASPLRAA